MFSGFCFISSKDLVNNTVYPTNIVVLMMNKYNISGQVTGKRESETFYPCMNSDGHGSHRYSLN